MVNDKKSVFTIEEKTVLKAVLGERREQLEKCNSENKSIDFINWNVDFINNLITKIENL